MSHLADFQSNMKKVLEHFDHELAAIRTGRANPAIIEDLAVEAYGAVSPLKQLAMISAPDATSLTIEPWDKGIIKDIEKALQVSQLGLTPSNEGTRIRLRFPALTEERRGELVKMIKSKLEEAKIRVRNERVDALKRLEKDELSEDEEAGVEKEIQKSVDEINKILIERADKKEKEIMSMNN